jgi:hypothetical protein
MAGPHHDRARQSRMRSSRDTSGHGATLGLAPAFLANWNVASETCGACDQPEP